MTDDIQPRRRFLKMLAACALVLPQLTRKMAMADSAAQLVLTDDEWRQRLTPEQYHILRASGTERAFSSALYTEKRAGVYACAGCGTALFNSDQKFDSGTGWPSFFDCQPDSLETRTDYKRAIPRVEYHCATCGGHHGHMFEDGPAPTGLRYCNNGDALKFIPQEG